MDGVDVKIRRWLWRDEKVPALGEGNADESVLGRGNPPDGGALAAPEVRRCR